MEKELTWESLNDMSDIAKAKKAYIFRYVEKQLDHLCDFDVFYKLIWPGTKYW
jgi:hypothetical protein